MIRARQLLVLALACVALLVAGDAGSRPEVRSNPGVGYSSTFGVHGSVTGFTPRSIANLALWLRADLGVTQAGGLVSRWADQSGQGHDVTASGTARPTIVTSDANFASQPSLSFNGTSNAMTAAFNLTPATVTIFAVLQYASATPGAFQFAVSTGDHVGSPGSSGLEVGCSNLNARTVNAPAVVDMTDGPMTASPEIWTAQSASGLVGFRVNGQAKAIVQPNTTPITTGTAGTIIGSRLNGSLFFAGHLVEVIAYDAALTLAQQQQVEAYLSARYGISVAAPQPPIASPAAWWRSDLGISLNGSTVSGWGDQSGNGNGATMATAARQPTFSASDSAYNNQPTLSFSGASSTELDFTLPATIPQPITIYVVGESNGGSGAQDFQGEGTNASATIFYNGSVWSTYANGTGVFSTNSIRSKQAYAATFNSASSAFYVNSSSSPFLGNVGLNGLHGSAQAIGSYHGGQYLTGKIAEILIYSGAHTAAQVSTVFQYFSARYSPGSWN